MKKRCLAATMCITMIAGIFAGCSGQEEQVANTEQQTTADMEEGGEITVWIPPYAASDAELTDQEFWDAQFDVFEEENNCTVRVEIIPWDGYIQKITTGITSGDGPDVIYIDTPYDLAASGALEPLESYFTEEELEQYIYWDLGKIGETQYVAPMLVGNAVVLYCNMDMLNAAGVEAVPQTWEEFMDACIKIKDNGQQPFLQAWGGMAKSMIMNGFLPFYWQSGGEFLNSDGNPDINNEYGLKTLEFLCSFMENGIFDETITAEDDVKTKFREGQVAMYIGDTGSSDKITEAGINWDFTPALTRTDGKQATWIAADSLAIASNSENKELAAKAMKYMLSAPVMDSFHETMYAMNPITKDAKYYGDERFESMYMEHPEIFHNWPPFGGSDAFYDSLSKNIQLMFMGDLTPQEVLDETMHQYDSQGF